MARPIFIIATAPYERAKIKNLLDPAPGGVIDLMKKPSQIRSSGWDMRIYENPKIQDGQYLEANVGGDKVIKVHDDGTCILQAAADSEYLGWGQGADKWAEKPVVNTLAFTELVLNYFKYYAQLLKKIPEKVVNLKTIAEFKNCLSPGKGLTLSPYEIKTYGWDLGLDGYEAKQDVYKISVDLEAKDLERNPGIPAHKIMRAMYFAYGAKDEEIERYPYTSHDESSHPYIDETKIK